MHPKSIIVLFLLLLNLTASADWVPKFSNKGSNGIIIRKVFYVNDDEAYASNGGGYIYHTLNNWKNYETIVTNIPAFQQVEFFEMTSKTKGIIVTRQIANNEYGRSFIYVTVNGGYKWERVFEMPIPEPYVRYSLSAESMFFQRELDKLYILYGDVISHGGVSGKNWETVRYESSRNAYNSSFKVLNDSIWSFKFFADPIYTNDKGKNWYEYIANPGIGDNPIGLGNLIQRFDPINNNNLEEYSFTDRKWYVLNSKYALGVKKILQLSDNYVLVYYWHWPADKNLQTVYDRKNNAWIDLDTLPNFFELKNWSVKGNGFVTISDDCRLLESEDFGQTWKAVMGDEENNLEIARYMSFNGNLGIVVSNSCSFSTDSGETWRHIESERFLKMFGDTLQGDPILSYDNDAQLYVLTDKIWKIVPKNDSFEFVQRLFKYENKEVSCNNISDKGSQGIFIIGRLEDSIYLFKSDGEGKLSRLLAIKHSPQINLYGCKVIQNKKYAVFSVDKSIYCYGKANGQLTLLTVSLINPTYSMDFTDEDMLVVGCYFNTYFYDFRMDTATHISHDADGLEKYGWQISMASDSEGKLLVSTGNVMYWTTSNNFNTFALDSTFIFNDYLNVVRNWKGHFWAGGVQNIYKNEEKAISAEVSCPKIETIWPNPFQSAFSILFKVETGSNINFQCYNELGQLIEDINAYYDMGLYERSVNLGDLARGIYFFKVTTDCGSKTYKMIRQ